MNWRDEKQARFDALRQHELTGTLNEAELEELEGLTTLLTQEADDALLPAIAILQREQGELESRLKQRQNENEELARLLHQDGLKGSSTAIFSIASELTGDFVLKGAIPWHNNLSFNLVSLRSFSRKIFIKATWSGW